MFEQHTQQQQSQTPNKPIDDMFASTDPVKGSGSPSIRPPVVTQVSSPMTSPPQPNVGGSTVPKRKNVVMFLIIVVVVGVAVGALAYYLTRKSSSTIPEAAIQDTSGIAADVNQEQQPVNEQPTDGNVVDTTPTPEIPEVPEVTPPVQEQPTPVQIDQDHDGLTQEEEVQVGSSDSLADTDLDGLTDWQEVRVYKSNPMNSDTDGDGYIDGHEVQNGYSPTGPGRLTEIPQS